jgi:hypothetical protein
MLTACGRLDPEILCYVLRQSPLRLVRVARLLADTAGARPWQPAPAPLTSTLAATLDDVEKHCPGLAGARLADTPDDQLLFFWADSARFVVSEPVTMARPVTAINSIRGEDHRHYRRIADASGQIVGRTAACAAVSDDEAVESGECEFILIASNAPPEHEKQKLAMQVKRRDGIAYRANVADIQADAWDAADVVRTLVALG